jgi:hypothetical protein
VPSSQRYIAVIADMVASRSMARSERRVAAGSYAALAFLVAAKGIVRSDEFDKNRDFAEYFLIGSLASVLVALCAGIALRFALIRLWPDLLSLQIQ